jgi:hypothetical protein
MNKSIVKELEEAAKLYKPRCKPWTPAEDEVLRRFYGRVNRGLLANKLGRSAEAVKSRWLTIKP